MSALTLCDLVHIQLLVDSHEYYMKEYPEMFTDEERDELKIVKQILREKLHECK